MASNLAAYLERKKTQKIFLKSLVLGVVAGAIFGVVVEQIGDIANGTLQATPSTKMVLLGMALLSLICIGLARDVSESIERARYVYEIRFPAETILGAIQVALESCGDFEHRYIESILKESESFFSDIDRFATLKMRDLDSICTQLDDASQEVSNMLLEILIAQILSYPDRLTALTSNLLDRVEHLDAVESKGWLANVKNSHAEIIKPRSFGKGPKWLMTIRFVSNLRNSLRIPLFCEIALTLQVGDEEHIALCDAADIILDGVLSEVEVQDLGLEKFLPHQC